MHSIKTSFILLLVFNLHSCAHKDNTSFRELANTQSCLELTNIIINKQTAEINTRLTSASGILLRALSKSEETAILKAHEVGLHELGINGKAAGIYNYNLRQLLQKSRLLHKAGFSPAEIRLLMEKKIVGDVTPEQIRAALMAEDLEPSMEVTIRASGKMEQYTALDTPAMVGKKILVNFFEDGYNPGSNESRYPVPQLILTKEFLDSTSQQVLKTLKHESINGNQQFEEVGAWIIYTNRGAYQSKTFTSHESFAIQNGPVLDSFDETYQHIQQAEGHGVQLVDIEFYHTHWERGEAFSFGDLDFQERYYGSKFKKLMAKGGSYSSYAVPVQGEVLFRHSIKNP